MPTGVTQAYLLPEHRIVLRRYGWPPNSPDLCHLGGPAGARVPW